MDFIENAATSAKAVADLREAVGWNRMESVYENPAMTSYYHIAVYSKKGARKGSENIRLNTDAFTE